MLMHLLMLTNEPYCKVLPIFIWQQNSDVLSWFMWI